MAALCLIAIVAFTPNASANFFNLHPGGVTGCAAIDANIGYRADNGYHTFRFESLSADMTDPTKWVRDHVLPPSMGTGMDPTPDAATDVWVTDTYYTSLCGIDWYQGAGDVNGGIVGAAICERTSSSGACNQHKVRYNNYFTDLVAGSGMRRELACHEIGHSVGLKHRKYDGTVGTKSCMPKGYPKPSRTYSTHDRSHLASY